MQTKPLISIITVVYNGEKYLEKTIQSVINQTYHKIEYIIIDGGSTDATLDIIKKYEDKINYWVSEKDKGIYDAMNKGILAATGEWINFMNVGDKFYNKNILKRIFDKNSFEQIDVIYGDHEVIYPNRTRISKAGNIKDIWKASQFSHQSAFISRATHQKYKYNINNTIMADFELFHTLFVENKNFKYLDFVVSRVTSGGVSDLKRVEGIVAMWNVLEKSTKVNFYYIYRILKEMLKIQIKKILYRGKN